MSRTAQCRSCGAEIIWTVTDAGGKRMPVDAHATPNGNLALYFPDRGRGPVVSKTYGYHEADAEAPRYTSHFATCPKAAEHRKPRARA